MKIRWRCRLSIHRWYYGHFIFPVYGRWERRCLECPETQYKNKNNEWTSYTGVVGAKI